MRLITLDGLPCAGKTTLALEIMDRLPKSGRVPNLWHLLNVGLDNFVEDTIIVEGYVPTEIALSSMFFTPNCVANDLILLTKYIARKIGLTFTEKHFYLDYDFEVFQSRIKERDDIDVPSREIYYEKEKQLFDNRRAYFKSLCQAGLLVQLPDGPDARCEEVLACL